MTHVPPTAPEFWIVGAGIVGTSKIWDDTPPPRVGRPCAAAPCPCSPDAEFFCVKAWLKAQDRVLPPLYYPGMR